MPDIERLYSEGGRLTISPSSVCVSHFLPWQYVLSFELQKKKKSVEKSQFFLQNVWNFFFFLRFFFHVSWCMVINVFLTEILNKTSGKKVMLSMSFSLRTMHTKQEGDKPPRRLGPIFS